MAGLRGRTFGGYQLVEQMPGGGIAEVYRGRPATTGGRDAVVKVIYPEFAHQPGFLPHFRQIVANSGRLANHPHVLPLLASGEDGGYLYLVTPYVEAGSLQDWIRKGGRMSAGDAAPFFRQLCDALTYAHSLSVVHGNLKPSNIFLFEGRHVLVGDFGLLWDVSHMDMHHAGSGTEAVEFLAPEVLAGQITQLSDVYSVGALLFAALTGHAPFRAATPADVFAAASRQPLPHLAQINPGLPPQTQALDPIIQRAMSKRPEDRFPSAAGVAQSIETTVRQVAAPPFSAGPGQFVPASGAIPLGSVPLPQSGGAMPYAPMPGVLGQGGGGAPFAAPGGFPAPALSLAQAAAAINSGGALGLAQLDPPFPPLPAMPTQEPQKEQGFAGGVPGSTGLRPAVQSGAGALPTNQPFAESTVHMPAPPAHDVPQQPTLRVPAPVPPPFPAAEHQPGLPGAAALPDFGAAPPPRPVRISGAPRAKLGRAGSAPFPTFDDDEGQEFGPQDMPAIRPPAGQNGFAVAGGNGTFDPGARAMTPPQNGSFAREAIPGSAALDAGPLDYSSGDERFAGNDGAAAFGASGSLDRSGNGYDFGASGNLAWSAEQQGSGAGAGDHWRRGYTGEQRQFGGYANDNQRENGWGDPSLHFGGSGAGDFGDAAGGGFGSQYSGEFTGAGAASYYGGADGYSDERPPSATALGLPRLTSPVLVDQPPSWHELVPEPGGAPGGMPNFRGSPGEPAPSWKDAGESMWQAAVQAPPRQDTSLPKHIEAEWAGSGIPGAWDTSSANSGKRKQKAGKKARAEEAEESGFDDDRVWTQGTTAVHPRRRLPRKLVLLLLVVMLIDLAALVVLRPDLCPNQGCRALSASLRQHFGMTQHVSASVPLTAAPDSITLSIPANKSATASLTMTNVTSVAVTWKASAGLSWVTLDVASGTLAANSTATLTLTAKPTSIKAGTYTTNITITLTGSTPQTLTIPVTLNVAA